MAAYRHWVGIEKGWQRGRASPLGRMVSLSPARLTRHCLAVGPTGCGKTTFIHHLIAQDVILGHSFVVLDLRGNLVRDALTICAGHVEPGLVRVLDLREKGGPSGFDPLRGNGEPYFRALGVLDAIEAESPSWGVQLAESLRNALMLLAESGHPLTRIEDLFYDPRFLMECLGACGPGPVAAFWLRFSELSREKRDALAAPVLNKTSLLLSTGTLRNILGHPDPVDLRGHLDRAGSVLLVSLAVDELHAAGRMFGRVALSSVCREIFARIDSPESRRNPVRLYVDECQNFESEEFETILAEGRKYGLHLVLAHQTLSQLSNSMRSLVLGNVGAKLVFGCGREDAAALSRDLTGDPKALDLSRLKTGEAVLWTRDGYCGAIEVSAPILPDPGGLGERALRFLAAIRESQRSGTGSPQSGSTKPAAERTGPREPAGLEDWLCG